MSVLKIIFILLLVWCCLGVLTPILALPGLSALTALVVFDWLEVVASFLSRLIERCDKWNGKWRPLGVTFQAFSVAGLALLYVIGLFWSVVSLLWAIPFALGELLTPSPKEGEEEFGQALRHRAGISVSGWASAMKSYLGYGTGEEAEPPQDQSEGITLEDKRTRSASPSDGGFE